MKKIELTPKRELAIKIVCVLILIILNIVIWYNGKDLSCERCFIQFGASRRALGTASNMQFQNFSIHINDLYIGLIGFDYCIIEFDSMQGYYRKNVTWNK